MKILDTERIPVPTIEAHAATILFHNGHRYVSWFGGKQEGNYCDIYGKYDDDSPVILATCARYTTRVNSCWNPILFPVDDKVMLSWKEGRFCDSWQTFIAPLDYDDDLELGKRISIPAGFNFTVKTKPLQGGGNLFICGSSVETANTWAAFVETYRITDKSVHITGRSNPILPNQPIKGLIQPTIWEQGAQYHMFARSSSDSDKLFHSATTVDHPLLWEQAKPTNIKNPNSSVDVVKHSNGKLYLICNDSATQRDPLSIYEIEVDDNAVNIKEEVYIELDFDEVRDLYPTARTRELSYPYAIEDPDGNIQIAYTFCRREIRIMTVEV